jgi:hypothetical protein
MVKFLLLSKISLNLSITNPNCLTISSGLGFSLNLIVFTTTFSNYFPKQCAASISILESPIQIIFVRSYIILSVPLYLFFLEYFWNLLFSIGHTHQGTILHRQNGLRLFLYFLGWGYRWLLVDIYIINIITI